AEYSQSIGIGDFNGDGNADVAVLGDNPDAVYVFPGNGDGTFGTPLTFSTGTSGSQFEMAIGDFNSDGLPDLAVAAHDSGVVSVLLNTTPAPRVTVTTPAV